MIYKKTYLILTLCLISIFANGQKQTNTWFFGFATGLDFNNTRSITDPQLGIINNIPTTIVGPIRTYEGCFTFSDKDGNFLFASDGMTVYNRNKLVMENGKDLLGHPSATQSGIVVPKPGATNEYYIVTVPYEGKRDAGYQYAVVDLNKNNNLGAITEKNKPLSYAGTGCGVMDTPENVTIVGHTNGEDYWLVSRMRSKFVVWAVTKSGFSEPKAYSVPFDLNHAVIKAYGMGTIKFSPDGKKIVHADYADANLSTGDFDPTTGVITNTTNVRTDAGRLYGVEFSPNGKFLYLTCIQYGVTPKNGLYIVPIDNITANLQQAIPNISNVQLGRGNRIYCISQYKRNSLWIILNPDEGGNKVLEITDAFKLQPTTAADKDTGLPWLGLPPFITTYFRLEGIYKSNDFPCINKEYEYELYIFQPDGTAKISYVEWDWGDGSPKVRQDYDQNENSYRVSHAYRKVGLMPIKVIPYTANGAAINSAILSNSVNVRYCNLIINSATTHSLN